MRFRIYILLIGCLCLAISGCRTTKNRPINSAGETIADVEKSVGTVASAMTGKPMTQEDVRRLERQMQDDPQARSAMETIAGGGASVVKYCPIDGERYAGTITSCPTHNVKLEIVQP